MEWAVDRGKERACVPRDRSDPAIIPNMLTIIMFEYPELARCVFKGIMLRAHKTSAILRQTTFGTHRGPGKSQIQRHLSSDLFPPTPAKAVAREE